MNMNKKYISIILILTGILFLSCNQNNKKMIPETSNEPDVVETITKSPEIYGIEGEDIVIRKGPGEKYEKLINVKATEALGETNYAQVDYSVKVIIQETNGDWSKIKVVDPEWLSNTHIGWILTKNILKSNSENEVDLKNLDSNDYEIIKTDHNSDVENFHVLIKQKAFDKESVFQFIKRFRNEHCSMNCNVLVYDSKSILPLIDKYPLKGKEYINLADHFISMSSFDAVNLKSWYPFQDFQYKEYGGQNWKKEKIK